MNLLVSHLNCFWEKSETAQCHHVQTDTDWAFQSCRTPLGQSKPFCCSASISCSNESLHTHGISIRTSAPGINSWWPFPVFKALSHGGHWYVCRVIPSSSTALLSIGTMQWRIISGLMREWIPLRTPPVCGTKRKSLSATKTLNRHPSQIVICYHQLWVCSKTTSDTESYFVFGTPASQFWLGHQPY